MNSAVNEGHWNALMHWLYDLAPETFDALMAAPNAPDWIPLILPFLALMLVLRIVPRRMDQERVPRSTTNTLIVLSAIGIASFMVGYTAVFYESSVKNWERSASFAKRRIEGRKVRSYLGSRARNLHW